MEEIGNIHVVHNQYALEKAGRKRLNLHRDRYAELRGSRYGSRVSREDRFIQTAIRPEETAEEMARRYTPGDVFALFAGDGGLHDVINGIHRIGAQPALKAARFLLIDRGFANDGAKQLNAGHMLRSPSRILDNGRTLRFAPLRWDIENENGSETHLAALYGTIGTSALVAQAISQESNRQWAGDNWFKKAWITRSTARKAPFTTIEDTGTGESREVYDVGFANGSRMSGFADAFPIALEAARSYHYEISSPNYVMAGIKLATRRIAGTYQSAPYSLYLPHGGAVQFDGEAYLLPPSDITVSQHDEKLRVFATRPNDSENGANSL